MGAKNEIGYLASRNVIMGVTKTTITETLGTASAGATREIAMNSAAAAPGLGGGIATFGVMGLTAALSAGLTQMDYVHKKNTITEFYKEELAAKLGKSKGKVTAQDLEKLSRGDYRKGVQANHTVSEELNKARKLRNFGIVFSIVASLASLAVVGAMAPGLESISGILGEGLKHVVNFVAHAGVGVIAYNLIKTPLHWLGDKIFGLDKETTHDRIVAIKRDREEGKQIIPEQVMSVFVSANRDLNEFITAKYGRKFDELAYHDKHAVTQNIGKLINVAALTENINQGRINATELAFSAEGQVSGVLPKLPKAPQKHGIFSGIKHKLLHAVERLNAPDFENPTESAAKENVTKDKLAVEYNNEAPKVSFVSRLGRAPVSTDLGHVQQLEQSRAESLATTRTT